MVVARGGDYWLGIPLHEQLLQATKADRDRLAFSASQARLFLHKARGQPSAASGTRPIWQPDMDMMPPMHNFPTEYAGNSHRRFVMARSF